MNTDLLNLKKIIIQSIARIDAGIVELKELTKHAKSISKAYENNPHVTVTEIEMEIKKMIE